MVDVDFGGRIKQLWAYDEALSKHGHMHEWMAFFDVDEVAHASVLLTQSSNLSFYLMAAC
jgi:hypothetical protein